LLTRLELRSLEEQFHGEIVEKINQVIYAWETEWLVTDKASHMQALAENLVNFQKYQERKRKHSEKLTRGIRLLNERIAELAEDEQPATKYVAQPPSPRFSKKITLIFDDVDE
jgi:hypothetical protein